MDSSETLLLRPANMPVVERDWLAPVTWLVVAALLAASAGFLPPFALRVGQLMFYSAGLALAWNLMGGLTGYRSFGHAAFIGIGAFAAYHAEAQFLEASLLLRLTVGLVAATVCCAVIAAFLAFPLLRLRGTYFALAMLGVSHIAGELNTNIDVLGGAVGVMFSNIVPDAVDPTVFFYQLSLGAMTLILGLSWLLRRSRFGYGLQSIREDEDTARMLGVPTERYKACIFVISAVLVGLLGAIYAHSLGYVNAASLYRDETNLNIVVFAMLGGIGTLIGPVVGAFLLTFLIHVVLSDYPNMHMFMTGLILVVLVLAAPDGLLGLGRRMMERFKGGRQ